MEGSLHRALQGEFPGTVLLNLATMEQFTHGWDLARAIGRPRTWIPGWPPACSARRGWRSATRSADLTAGPCSGPPARLRPERDRLTSSPPSSAG